MKKVLIMILFLIIFSISNSEVHAVKEEGQQLIHILNNDSPIEATVNLSLDVTETVADINLNYLLKNPTSQDVTLSLAVKKDLNYSLLLEGNPIDVSERYVVGDEIRINNDYYQDSLYNKDSKIKKMTYQVSSPEFLDYNALTISSLVQFDETKTHFITSTDNINHEILNVHTITNWVNKDGVFDLYVIGDDVETIEWKIYKNSRLLQEVAGEVKLVSEDELTLGELLLADCPLEINSIDWFNNKIQMLKADANYATSFEELDLKDKLECYLLYDLSIGANSSVNHQMEVKMPAIVDDSYTPAVYHFNFNFAELNKLALVNLSLCINSGYYLIEPDFSFTKNDNQYQATIDNIDNIQIALSTSANPEPNLDMLELSIKIVFSGIAILVLFTLMIFPKKIRKNYYYSDFQLRPKIDKMYRRQNYLAIIAIILSLVGMHYKIWFSAIALFVVAIAFITALVAHFKYRMNNAVGLIALALAITSNANLLYQYQEAFEVNTVIVCLCILVYGINNLTIYNDVEKNKEEAHYFLPLDFMSKKAFGGYVFFVFLLMFLGMTILIIEFEIVYIILITIFNLILVVIYRVVKVFFVDYKPLRRYYKDLDYESLKIKMESKLSDDNIHPKTYNGYLIRLAEISLANNYDDYIKYISSFKAMLKKQEQIDYDCLRLNYLLSKREFFGFYQELRIKYADYPNLFNKAHKRYNYWLPYYNGEVSESIVLQYPYRGRNHWVNARNLFIQINHYFSRGNSGKARELGKIFKKEYSNVKLLNEKINSLNLNRL